mmetsp:Transcript_111610/g.193720  ORF Transcript_111610/g.193720 Transcript_111610/m.193720 type:complete len:368 (-) Transcript_111610:430-1533(-)
MASSGSQKRGAVVQGDVVAVTGASGYIGSHICKVLLEMGFKVRAVVRNKDDEVKTAHLRKLAEGLPEGTLTFFSGDLAKEGSYDSAFDGADGVIHSAAVVEINDVSDPQKEIVDPSVAGTNNVLQSLDKSTTVKRVVHTSSIAAVQSVDQPDETVFTEKDWNTWSTIENGDPYGYAKAQAERLVHDHVAQGTPYDFAVVLPGISLGPCLTKAHSKASVVIIRQALYGNEQPSYYGSYVDVRDVAVIHVEALVSPAASGQRFIAVNTKASCWVKDLEGPMQRLFPDYKVEFVTRSAVVIGLAKFAALFGIGPLNPYRQHMLEKRFTFSNEAASRDLGVTFTEMDESIKDSVESMVGAGYIKPRLNKKP